jgi:membrane protease YdiL (CAAX protease family)
MGALPRAEYVPSRTAGWYLVGVACLLLPVDGALIALGSAHQELRGTFRKNNKQYAVHSDPVWILPVRLAVPVVVLLTLLGLKRLDRRDIGWTFGEPRVTFFWTLVPSLVLLVGFLALGGAAILFFRSTDWPLPKELTEPIDTFWVKDWPRDLTEACILFPLVEEILYRGVSVPALERLGGARLAVIGSGLLFAGLHVVYHAPLAWMPWYVLCGMYFAWMFVRTRSLVPTLFLHSAENLFVPFLLDLLKLSRPEFIPSLFGR